MPTFWEQIIDQLESGDVCAFVFVLLVLTGIANAIVGTRRDVQAGGVRCGLAATLAWIIRDVLRYGFDFDVLGSTCIRALLVGWFVMATAWIVLRIAVWLLGSPGMTLQGLSLRFRTWRQRCRDERKRRKQDREYQARLLRERAEFESPARQRERAVASEREQQRSMQEASDRTRREQARFSVRILYDRYRPKQIAQKLPEEKFAAYLEDYLSDKYPAELIEQRAETVKQLIRDALELSDLPRRPVFENVEDIVAFYNHNKETIQSLPCDRDIQDVLLINIDRDLQSAIEDFLRR